MDSIITKINKLKNEIIIKIDTREKEIVEKLKDNEFVKIEQLDIGDIQFLINDEIILMIERKTLSDLSNSIKDGRLREQKLRLISTCDNEKIMYIIEGKYSTKMIQNLDEQKISGIKITSLIGAQTNIIVRDGLKVLRTSCVDETIYLILNLYYKYQVYDKQNINKQTDYVDVIKLKKKKNMTPQNCFILQLAQIPGCSVNVAKIIADEVKSMINLCDRYSQLETIEEKQKMLEKITYQSKNKTRKIGPKLSTKIYQYVHNDSDLITVPITL